MQDIKQMVQMHVQSFMFNNNPVTWLSHSRGLTSATHSNTAIGAICKTFLTQTHSNHYVKLFRCIHIFSVVTCFNCLLNNNKNQQCVYIKLTQAADWATNMKFTVQHCSTLTYIGFLLILGIFQAQIKRPYSTQVKTAQLCLYFLKFNRYGLESLSNK